MSRGCTAPELQSRPAHCRSRTASLLERGSFFSPLKAKKNVSKATSGMAFFLKENKSQENVFKNIDKNTLGIH